MALSNFGKVGVLMGGTSSEREISLKSGSAVLEALKGANVNAVGIDIKNEDLLWISQVLKSEALDCAFIALHGRFGEDGQIQKILEDCDIPYTGSGVQASALAMDKIASLKVLHDSGLRIPRWQALHKEDYLQNADIKLQIGFPLVVKPANHGSSIGLSIIHRPELLEGALELAFRYDQRVVIQEYIKGRELTVGVLDEQALAVVEIITKNAYFDFQAKYQPGLTEYIVPAKLDQRIGKNVQDAGLRAHQALGCSGCSRTDIILSPDSLIYLLEVNTIPGMTATSLLPKAAKVLGISFSGLCLKLLNLAYEKTKV
ncbi:MAG: D-alanine--D-alanine ligase [Candidatus Omnitrophica bacterium]|jgi:D-alanine-D-alanine ligase|nr:D-alanine--D-alanine ligase [Candidatus Omnitrophota bacterium]